MPGPASDPDEDDPRELDDQELRRRLYARLCRVAQLDEHLLGVLDGLQDLPEYFARIKEIDAWVQRVWAAQQQLQAQLEQARDRQDRLLRLHQALLTELRLLRAEELVEDVLSALDDDGPPRAAPGA